ncbi:MAG: M48 family metallopeptidase [Lachnospiraceae bacterium]|nr:M48 family metallopeptidase [Lachnospiraceae bacterium]
MVQKYEIIRSSRKTLGIEIRRDGSLLVRSPRRLSKERIEQFLEKHSDWILKHQTKVMEQVDKAQAVETLTPSEIRALAEKAALVIPERVRYFAPIVGVKYGRITIRKQKTRWGSCSGKGNLNFNCLLMLAPPEVLDSVVVHELCHLKEMNHSERFYKEVLRAYPEYHKWHGWLKENGAELLQKGNCV